MHHFLLYLVVGNARVGDRNANWNTRARGDNYKRRIRALDIVCAVELSPNFCHVCPRKNSPFSAPKKRVEDVVGTGVAHTRCSVKANKTSPSVRVLPDT
jgi:hypothetical protein